MWDRGVEMRKDQHSFELLMSLLTAYGTFVLMLWDVACRIAATISKDRSGTSLDPTKGSLLHEAQLTLVGAL